MIFKWSIYHVFYNDYLVLLGRERNCQGHRKEIVQLAKKRNCTIGHSTHYLTWQVYHICFLVLYLLQGNHRNMLTSSFIHYPSITSCSTEAVGDSKYQDEYKGAQRNGKFKLSKQTLASEIWSIASICSLSIFQWIISKTEVYIGYTWSLTLICQYLWQQAKKCIFYCKVWKCFLSAMW